MIIINIIGLTDHHADVTMLDAMTPVTGILPRFHHVTCALNLKVCG